MENISTFWLSKDKVKSAVFDVIAVTFVFLAPSISHMLSFPLYLLEPLRIFLILSIVHTRRMNAYILALSLPIVSFLISGHPVFYKMLIISTELIVNVWLFFILAEKIKNLFAAMLSSILISKLFYYLIQYMFINFGLLTLVEVEHPILSQIFVTIVLSLYVYLISKRKKTVD